MIDMKKIMNYLMVLFVCGFIACSGNDKIEYIEPWTEEYVLPQGKSDADDRIMNYYDQYGTYILYEYSDLEFRYEFPNLIYDYELPDLAYVGDMLDLLEDIWFDFYPVDFHKKYMPLKIMLAKQFVYQNTFGVTTLYFTASGTSSIGIGFCSDTLRKITPETKLGFKNDLQGSLWTTWLNKVEFPDEFFTISDYSYNADMDPMSDNYARKRGFVTYYFSGMALEWSTSGTLDSQIDLLSFLTGMLIRTSEDWKTDLEYPLVKKKYDILRSWFQEKYGFDMQNIGDATF